MNRLFVTFCALLLSVPALGAPTPQGGAARESSRSAPRQQPTLRSTPRSRKAVEARRPHLAEDLRTAGLSLGAPVFLRIVKYASPETGLLGGPRLGRLELWLRGADARYKKFRDYPICSMSGSPGPKTKTGDEQAPEGFYEITPDLMKPDSTFHLAMNVGYPNAFDRALGRTGSFIMIHGSCVSIGCFAMTDEKIEEIWTVMQAAFEAGQKRVPTHIFPFEMTDAVLARVDVAASPHHAFWSDLAAGWQLFERDRVPPKPRVQKGRYLFDAK